MLPQVVINLRIKIRNKIPTYRAKVIMSIISVNRNKSTVRKIRIPAFARNDIARLPVANPYSESHVLNPES